MREILFRGQRVDNGNWIEGYLYVYWNFERKVFQIFVDRTNGIPDSFEVNPDTVGQYIGRKDKNKTQIFDGDLVKTKYGRICQVVWFEQRLCWDLKPVANLNYKSPDEWDMWYSENLEVIGNVYDTPELMEVAK